MLLAVPPNAVPTSELPRLNPQDLLSRFATSLSGSAAASSEELEHSITTLAPGPSKKDFYILQVPELSRDIILPSHVASIEIQQVRLRSGERNLDAWRVRVNSDDKTDATTPALTIDSFLDTRRDQRPRLIKEHRLGGFSDADASFEEAIRDSSISAGEVDSGIGRYEYWGHKGVQHDSQAVVGEKVGTLEWQFECGSFPELGGTFSATKSIFICTGSKHSDEHDESFEDGYDQDFDFEGTVTRAVISPRTTEIEGKPVRYYQVDAQYEWEQAG